MNMPGNHTDAAGALRSNRLPTSNSQGVMALRSGVGRRVCGSSFGGVKGRDGVPLLIERWLAGEIDAESFISHRITLDEVNRGFELMEAQDGIRSVIQFT